jgi:hypothetical protein
MTAADLWAEFNAARAAMEPPDRAMLEGYRIAPGDVVFLVGITCARVSGGLYEPDPDGGEAFVTPVLIDDPIGPETISPAQTIRFGEIVDLVAWHPRHPDAWALRVGAAEWIGAIPPQSMPPIPPVPFRRSMLAWFQHRCTGLMLLATERAARYRLLTGCRGGISVEDARHLAELRGLLEQSWPCPPLFVGGGGLRNAA